MRELRIAVLAGDGIGPEVMTPCLELLAAVTARSGDFQLRFEWHEAGAGVYQRTGVALPPGTLAAAQAADAILLGAMGLPGVRCPDGTEVVPQVELRERLHLYAGVRPVFVWPGVPTPLGSPRAREIDFVLVRESTEGLFAARQLTRREGDDVVYDTLRISRQTSRELFDFAFQLARRRASRDRAPRVTCIDKANVLPAFAFFRSIFLEAAEQYPDVEAECVYVDAAALKLVREPWIFDVMVTENMFGDILSDLGAGLMGGMGMAPSADIGRRHAVFQPCHGTAPDLVGRDLANPTAMFLSGAMMLDWLADQHHLPGCSRAGREIRRAVRAAFATGVLSPVETGGTSGTREIIDEIYRALEAGAAELSA